MHICFKKSFHKPLFFFINFVPTISTLNVMNQACRFHLRLCSDRDLHHLQHEVGMRAQAVERRGRFGA